MENSISSDLIRGHIDTIILQTISSADKNSQEILDDISSSSDGKYELKQPTLYSSLKRLESDGFIKSFWRDAEDGRRKFYHLTDKGRALVRKNLNDWKFSRAVIDSLVKAEPDVRTEIVYKEVPLPVKETAKTPRTSENTPKTAENAGENSKKSNFSYDSLLFASKNNDVKPQETVFTASPTVHNVQTSYTEPSKESFTAQNTQTKNQDINFRNILNGLIKYSEQHSEKPEAPQEMPEIKQNISDKPKFSDEITKTDRRNVNSDFGDIIDYCENKHLKLRVSAKSSANPTGVYINKVNFSSSIAVFLLLVIELLIIFTKFKSVLPGWAPFSLVIFAVFPLIMTLKYVSEPKKTIYKRLSSKDVLQMTFIIMFSLIFLNVVMYIFILGLDFSSDSGLITYLVVPILLYVDSFMYYLIRSLLFKKPSYKNFSDKSAK